MHFISFTVCKYVSQADCFPMAVCSFYIRLTLSSYSSFDGVEPYSHALSRTSEPMYVMATALQKVKFDFVSKLMTILGVFNLFFLSFNVPHILNCSYAVAIKYHVWGLRFISYTFTSYMGK